MQFLNELFSVTNPQILTLYIIVLIVAVVLVVFCVWAYRQIHAFKHQNSGDRTIDKLVTTLGGFIDALDKQTDQRAAEFLQTREIQNRTAKHLEGLLIVQKEANNHIREIREDTEDLQDKVQDILKSLEHHFGLLKLELTILKRTVEKTHPEATNSVMANEADTKAVVQG